MSCDEHYPTRRQLKESRLLGLEKTFETYEDLIDSYRVKINEYSVRKMQLHREIIKLQKGLHDEHD